MKKNQPRRQDSEVDDLVEGIVTYLKSRSRLELLPRLAVRLSEPTGEERKIIDWIKQAAKIKKGEDFLPLLARRLAEVTAFETSGTSGAEVISAVPLTEEELSRVAAILEKRLGRKVEVKNRVDPGVKGGLVCRLGDQVIDLSLARTFAELRKSLG
jgi:hypothetical protein